MRRKFLECGKLVNTHGVMGGLKAESWCDSPETLAGLKRVYLKKGEEYAPLTVTKASVFKDMVIFVFDGISDMDAAQALKNSIIYADRDDLQIPDDRILIADLLELDVLDAETGKKYGILKDVISSGGTELYVIQTEHGERMVPNVSQFVKRRDPEAGIFITPIPGLMDDE